MRLFDWLLAGDVFSVDISPPYAVSGGEDDRAYVWKLEDGGTVFECTGEYPVIICTFQSMIAVYSCRTHGFSHLRPFQCSKNHVGYRRHGRYGASMARGGFHERCTIPSRRFISKCRPKDSMGLVSSGVWVMLTGRRKKGHKHTYILLSVSVATVAPCC